MGRRSLKRSVVRALAEAAVIDVFVTFFLHDLLLQPLVNVLAAWMNELVARLLVAGGTFVVFFLILLALQNVARSTRRAETTRTPRSDSLLHSVPFLIALCFFATVVGILVSQVLPTQGQGPTYAIVLGAVGCFVVAMLSRRLVSNPDSPEALPGSPPTRIRARQRATREEE